MDKIELQLSFNAIQDFICNFELIDLKKTNQITVVKFHHRHILAKYPVNKIFASDDQNRLSFAFITCVFYTNIRFLGS